MDDLCVCFLRGGEWPRARRPDPIFAEAGKSQALGGQKSTFPAADRVVSPAKQVTPLIRNSHRLPKTCRETRMSIQDNPNIIRITGAVKEYNGRTFLGRNGVDDIDDVWHYAYIVIEDTNGALLKFERVTTNEKIDAEIEIGNTATFYFRRIQGWKKSVFHIVATESEVRGNNYFSLVRTIDVLKQRLVAIGILPIAYLFGWIFVGLPVSYIFGTTLAAWLVLIVRDSCSISSPSIIPIRLVFERIRWPCGKSLSVLASVRNSQAAN
ncbi:hypothetical protein Ddc_22016 [Ditylenchus destructor]|nr:hypothetical protein Ddc_22016 [Ditylenchus destructor]